MSDQIQNTLESTLPALKHLLDTHKLTKQQVSKIMERRKLMLHRPFTKDNALRFLEYESKLDMYLKHKDSYNTFLDVLYKRVICKFRDEAVFTMFVKHLIGERIVCDDEGDKKNNRSFDVNRARYVDKYSLNTLKTFCLTYLKRNRTQYLTLLMANTFYKIGDVNTGRKLFVDAMRLSTDKSITKMMMECEQACHSTYQTTSSKEIIEALRKELE
ncbi:hypothetical protein VCUG_01815 [Vavraia culicis subsp. floridensis]|uniref:Uncharacterized protein n=1 Tax=Vavraia culicis (isolate floridensis) TaxID=948595 RepID=L2GU79_VAVCU|nr:uncharacterized protein VCUG_01815 [Vavraia culicis subsp. floridensis]ELA46665.1 hypothetical protein VCUG_01815 [Vavraia culicis subsp. floridensis]